MGPFSDCDFASDSDILTTVFAPSSGVFIFVRGTIQRYDWLEDARSCPSYNVMGVL